MTLTIGGVSVGGDTPCRFVFEVSNAHNGSLERAHRLIGAAKECGADFVKFQAYTPAELVALRGNGPAPEPWGSQGWTMQRLYEKAQTSLAWLPELFQHARDIGIVPFSSVFGPDSLHVLEHLDCPAYKIARLDNRQYNLAMSVGACCALGGKPLFVSSSDVATLEIQSGGPEIQTRWLWCPAGYPAPAGAVHLPIFEDRWLGLSSHCLDARLPVAAVARGCKLIEMHGMLDDEPSELEAEVSLTATEFADMIVDVRATEAMLA